MIYQCTGCNQDKDDDTDIGTLIGEDYYCEGCLAIFISSVMKTNRNAVLDEVKDKAMNLSPRTHPRRVFLQIIESLKGEMK